MDFSTYIQTTFFFIVALLTSSPLGLLFAGSTVLVVAGLAWQAWFQGVQLSTLSHTSLRDVELRHPNIPSLHTVLLILMVTMQQYTMSLIVLRGTVFMHDPREWVLFGGIFVVSMAVGILVELHWRSVGELFFAFSTGTLAAFLFFLIQSVHMQYSFITLALSVLSFLSVLFLVLLYQRTKSRGIPIVFLITLMLWLVLRFVSL